MRKLLVVVAVAVAALGCGDRVFCGEGGVERGGLLYCYPTVDDGRMSPTVICVHPDVENPVECAINNIGCDRATQVQAPGRCELTADGFADMCEGGWVPVCLET